MSVLLGRAFVSKTEILFHSYRMMPDLFNIYLSSLARVLEKLTVDTTQGRLTTQTFTSFRHSSIAIPI